jgi:hypothetical protein
MRYEKGLADVGSANWQGVAELVMRELASYPSGERVVLTRIAHDLDLSYQTLTNQVAPHLASRGVIEQRGNNYYKK